MHFFTPRPELNWLTWPGRYYGPWPKVETIAATVQLQGGQKSRTLIYAPLEFLDNVAMLKSTARKGVQFLVQCCITVP